MSILLLQTISGLLFNSCGYDDSSNIHYMDNKYIEGKWYSLIARDSMVYTFKGNNASFELYAHIMGMDTLKYEGKENFGNYLLTDSLILFSEHSDIRFIYKLKNDNDSLYIRSPKDIPILWIGFKKLKE